jgi:hypothetical protein
MPEGMFLEAIKFPPPSIPPPTDLISVLLRSLLGLGRRHQPKQFSLDGGLQSALAGAPAATGHEAGSQPQLRR